jgi:hypothetical protein
MPNIEGTAVCRRNIDLLSVKLWEPEHVRNALTHSRSLTERGVEKLPLDSVDIIGKLRGIAACALSVRLSPRVAFQSGALESLFSLWMNQGRTG